MNILFVLEYFYPHIGGVEKAFYNQTIELAKKNRVTVLTSRIKGTAGREIIKGVEIIRINTPGWAQRYWFMVLAIPVLFRIVSGFDIIHTTTYNAALTSWIVGRIFKKKIVITVHEVIGKKWFSLSENNKFLQLGYYIFEKLLFKLNFDRYIAVSEATRKDLLSNSKIDKKKVIVSYPILDTKYWDRNKYKKNTIRERYGLKKDQFIYLYFGRSGISKGPEYLIDAVSKISSKIEKSKLLMVLSPHPKKRYCYLVNLIKRINSDDQKIILVPPLSNKDLPKYILSSNCVVVPSLTEGYGYSALEACLLGVPVIATKVGSLQEVLPKGTLFIEPKNPEEIANAVYRIYQISQKRKIKVGIPKPLFSKNYGIDEEKFYQNL